ASVVVCSVGCLTSLDRRAVPIRKSWRSGLPGAVFTLAMWVLDSCLVRWALGFSSGGMSIYGPLAAPIAVLLWLYVLSISVLIGAAVNESIDHQRHGTDNARSTSHTQTAVDSDGECGLAPGSQRGAAT